MECLYYFLKKGLDFGVFLFLGEGGLYNYYFFPIEVASSFHEGGQMIRQFRIFNQTTFERKPPHWIPTKIFLPKQPNNCANSSPHSFLKCTIYLRNIGKYDYKA